MASEYVILPISIKKKISRCMELRTKAAKVEQEIIDWFESKGWDTSHESFTRVIDKLSNCDATPEEIEEILDDIKDGFFR